MQTTARARIEIALRAYLPREAAHYRSVALVMVLRKLEDPGMISDAVESELAKLDQYQSVLSEQLPAATEAVIRAWKVVRLNPYEQKRG